MTRFLFVLLLVTTGCSEFDLQTKQDPVGAGVPDIAVTPAAIQFGDLLQGEQEIKSYVVENVGDAMLHVTDMQVVSGLGFTILTPPAFDLEIGQTMNVDVAFTPMLVDNYGTIHVFSDDPDSPEVPVDLLGFGAVPELQITPSFHDFGETFLPCGSVVDLELRNVGREPLTITDASYLSGGFLELSAANLSLPLTLTMDEAVFVTVSFAAVDEGADTGTLSVTSNDPRGVVNADQTGEGVYMDEVTEVFEEPGIAPVDVLFLIDQSCSMSDDNIGPITNGIPGFINELQQLTDFQLIEVTKDSGCANGGIVDAFTPNAANVLINNAFNAGILEQLNTEMLLKQAEKALSLTDPGECNAGFLRPGALLHIVVASDEREQSVHDHNYWLGQYLNYVPNPDMVTVSSIVDINYACGDNSGPGGYLEAANVTGGTVLDICNANWGAQMNQIAQQAVAGIRAYNLASPTEVGTIVVTVNGVATVDFVYNPVSWTVTIQSPSIGEGDIVEITYSPGSDC